MATDEGLGELLLERFPYAKVRHFLWEMAQDGARLEAASGRQLNRVISWDDYGSPRYSMMRRDTCDTSYYNFIEKLFFI